MPKPFTQLTLDRVRQVLNNWPIWATDAVHDDRTVSPSRVDYRHRVAGCEMVPRRSSTPFPRLLSYLLVAGIELLIPSSAAAQTDTVDSLLARAAESLDGSTCVMDRRGNPAAARDLIQRAITKALRAGDIVAVGRALGFEVRAAASAGDYSRGRRAAAEAQALDPLLSLGARTEVSAVGEWFRFLGDAVNPFVWNYDREVRTRQPVMPKPRRFAFAPEPAAAPSAIDPLALTELLSSNADLVQSRSEGGQTDRLVDDYRKRVVPSCAAGAGCPWDALFLGELLYAAGRADAAADAWSRAAGELEAAGDFVLAAVTRMREGDALAAPLSSPLELNLLVVSSLSSGLALATGRAAPELDAIPKERLDRARDRYLHARRVLARGRCPRCTADLDAREGYLLLASGHAAEAGQWLRDVSHRYKQLGDYVYAPATAAAAAGALMIAGDMTAAAAVTEELAIDLVQSHSTGAAIGAARLFGRVAFRIEHGGADSRVAEEALNLALLIADRTGLTQVGSDLLTQKGDVLIRLGRRHEGLLLQRDARNATQAYMAAVPTMTQLQQLNKVEDELGRVRREFVLSTFKAYAAFLAERDVAHAREANEQIRTLLRKGVGEIPSDLRQLTDQFLNGVVERNEVQLLLAESRFEEALAAATTLGDPMLLALAHRYLGHNDVAAAIARAETTQAIDQLPAVPGSGAGIDDLQLQRLRNRIQEGVGMLASAHAGADAQRLLATVGTKWKGPKAGLDWLYDDRNQPWARDVAEAEVDEALGNLAEAESKLLRATTDIARTAASLGDLHAREGFDADWASVDRSYVRVLAAQGRRMDALLALEGSRGRVYHQQLVAAHALTDKGQSEALLRSWWRAEAEVRGLQLRAAAGEPIPAAQIASAEATTQQLRRRLDREVPVMSALLDRGNVADRRLVDDVRASLKGPVPTALLAYFVGNREDVYVWVVTAADLHMRKLAISGRDLREATVALYNRLATPQDNWEAPSRRLYEALVRPIQDLLPHGTGARPRPRLGILPHGPTNVVPFAALRDEHNVPVVQRFDIFYSPSLRTYLGSARRRAAGSARVESFGYNGDVLTFAEHEAATIARPPHVHVGRSATRGAILEAAQHAVILHLATHATQDEANPFAARLLTADGALTLAEMIGVPWRVRLVTLSACDTAAGRLTEADEFTGISRGLLAAGVPAVLTTGWRIDDESTAKLMNRFYRRIAAGASPVEALGDAQRATLAQGGDASHPAFWAPFMIIGADR